MIIDWITARLPFDHFSEEEWLKLRQMNDHICRFNPITGEISWETCAWDSVRSDSHGVAYKVSSDCLMIQGSPCRVIADGCNVFGAGPAASLDLAGCVERMSRFVFEQLEISYRGHPWYWKVSRIDVTGNLYVGSLSQVQSCLEQLRGCNGGRYRVSQQAGDTVYWSHRSRLLSGKAYAKGPHLTYQMNKSKSYDGKIYTTNEIDQANGLLRLELKIGSQYIRERLDKEWFQLSNGELYELWDDYFGRMIGDVDVKGDKSLLEKCLEVAPTDGAGRSAYGCWLVIKNEGWEIARISFAKSSWYRHMKILRDAGLSDMDISHGKVVEFRRSTVELKQVDSWAELHQLAS
ncbi:MAG: phage/plasmid replication protein, II/X family [Pseudomonadales bacterium]|nr:phage/plasmid replication protein, II/X family [Pseudomonadales bacterium]